MKLAAIYNVWDGEELFEQSLNSIKDHVDDVIIVWQEQSNFGEYYDPLYAIAGKGHLHKYTPDLTESGQQNEINKRMIGIRLAAQRGNTHFLHIDCDEIYDPKQFAQAKEKAKNYDVTACRLYTYYKEPCYRLTPIEDYWVPFICKIKKGMGIGNFFKYCDPTRGVSSGYDSTYAFEQDELMMHHYSYIRNDIGRKLRNSSARGNFKDIAGMVERFNNWKEGDPLINFEGYEIEKV